ncbi:MAG: hypothetical protein KGM43_07190 [Planctomycetota bacterium]|nr:hypothetical protein [Planctomycetota bacterium]
MSVDMTARALYVGVALVGGACAGLVRAGQDEAGRVRIWKFAADAAGGAPSGFKTPVGSWIVESSPRGKLVVQHASNADPVFNVMLAEGVSATDVDLSVNLRAVAGELDRGGGVVWRARDAKNYYVARYNPLEDNLRVYKVVDGVRSQHFQDAAIVHDDRWYSLRVVMKGDHIEVYLDDKKYLDAHDDAFPGAGTVGLWTKSDARTKFENLTLRKP